MKPTPEQIAELRELAEHQRIGRGNARQGDLTRAVLDDYALLQERLRCPICLDLPVDDYVICACGAGGVGKPGGIEGAFRSVHEAWAREKVAADSMRPTHALLCEVAEAVDAWDSGTDSLTEVGRKLDALRKARGAE